MLPVELKTQCTSSAAVFGDKFHRPEVIAIDQLTCCLLWRYE